MKHGKNPTRVQKKIISEYRLNADNWLVEKVFSDKLRLIHRHTGHVREVFIRG